MERPSSPFIELTAPGVRALRPYEPGKPVEELEREFGISDSVKLASNENPLGPSPRAVEAVRDALPELARYPDGGGFELKQALAKRHGVAPGQITLGNGSNEILELLVRTFVTPENEVVFYEHGFAVYPIVTQAAGARAVIVPACRDAACGQPYGHDLAAMRDGITDRTRLIFIANPNNPTGTWLDGEALRRFIADVPPHVLVVIDEAYFEYARDLLAPADYPDCVAWVTDHDNLVVTRTFSKAYGLAGLRVGYAVSAAPVSELLNRVRQPFNINSLALAAAHAALADEQHLARTLEVNRAGMEQLYRACEASGLAWIPSAANFLCIDVASEGARVYDALLHEGVIVRPVANYGLPRHLRVTVGVETENARFIEALAKVR